MIKRILLNRKTLIFIGLIFIALIVFGLSNLSLPEKKSVGEIKISENNLEWNLYVNNEYKFSIEFPSDWKLVEDFEDVSPIINIYKPEPGILAPFDHFTDINNVSIFPKGLETEAVIGETQNSKIIIQPETEESLDYLLENDDIWATYITFVDDPEPWKPWGFIWARQIIENPEYYCKRKGEKIEMKKCNPFGGDEFIRSGNIDPKIRTIQEKIIESFTFIE